MVGRCSSIVSSQLAAVALLLLLLICFSHRAAAARPLPAAAVPALVHHANGVEAAASADDLVLQEGAGASTNSDELSISEMMGADTTEEAACEEGMNDDECLQRRLLRDAHLDYIYTQHKGKP